MFDDHTTATNDGLMMAIVFSPMYMHSRADFSFKRRWCFSYTVWPCRLCCCVVVRLPWHVILCCKCVDAFAFTPVCVVDLKATRGGCHYYWLVYSYCLLHKRRLIQRTIGYRSQSWQSSAHWTNCFKCLSCAWIVNVRHSACVGHPPTYRSSNRMRLPLNWNRVRACSKFNGSN